MEKSLYTIKLKQADVTIKEFHSNIDTENHIEENISLNYGAQQTLQTKSS